MDDRAFKGTRTPPQKNTATSSTSLANNPNPVSWNEPVKLGGQEFEAGTDFIPCIYLVHRDPNLYPEPDLCIPERFLERQYSPSEFFPFGGGSRKCIGYALALYEMKLVIATLLLNWQLELTDREPIKPVRRGIITSLSTDLGMKGVGNTPLKNFAARTQDALTSEPV